MVVPIVIDLAFRPDSVVVPIVIDLAFSSDSVVATIVIDFTFSSDSVVVYRYTSILPSDPTRWWFR